MFLLPSYEVISKNMGMLRGSKRNSALHATIPTFAYPGLLFTNTYYDMRNTITVRHEILIFASKRDVWNFTQDFDRRMLWDKSIVKCEILQRNPFKLVRIKTIGIVKTELMYRLCRKFDKTSLQMTNTKSPIICGGGGSWNYESKSNGTKWTQTNSLIIRNRVLFILFGSLIERQLSYNTKLSMRTAKELIEW